MRRLTVLVSIAAVLLLSACEAKVDTAITITSQDNVDVEMTVTCTLTYEAAAAFTRDVQLLARLERLVADKSDGKVKRSVADNKIVLTVKVAPEKVTEASGLTGIAAISVAPGDDDTANLRIAAVPPTDLVAALAATPDEDAVPLLLDGTSVTVEVVTGGDVKVSGVTTDLAAGVAVRVKSDDVTFTRVASSKFSGELVVEADPVSKSKMWLWVVLAAAAGAAGFVALKRR